MSQAYVLQQRKGWKKSVSFRPLRRNDALNDGYLFQEKSQKTHDNLTFPRSRRPDMLLYHFGQIRNFGNPQIKGNRKTGAGKDAESLTVGKLEPTESAFSLRFFRRRSGGKKRRGVFLVGKREGIKRVWKSGWKKKERKRKGGSCGGNEANKRQTRRRESVGGKLLMEKLWTTGIWWRGWVGRGWR